MALSKTSRRDDQDVVEILSEGDAVEEIPMGIAPGAMAMIIDRLTDAYTKPVEATVRETVSNAIDATMRMAPEDRKPVEVTLPTNLRSTFVIRDHGVGMSRAEVKKNFAQYGESTKADDFAQTGAYGLGAKAPLSYCTEFSVSTTKDGVTINFTVSRESLGNMTKITSVVESGAPSGTVISIPVRMGDLEDFQNAISGYQKYSFDVPVIIDRVEPGFSGYTVLDDSFVIDPDSGTTGRIFVRNAALGRIVKTALTTSSDLSFSYILSGWRYASPTESSYRDDFDVDILVELKPGVVDFSTSRDEITLNDRARSLDRRVSALINNLDEDKLKAYLAVYRTFNDVDSRRFLSAIISSVRFADDGGLMLFHKHSYYSDSSVPVNLEAFTLDSGSNLLAAALKPYAKNVTVGFTLERFSSSFGTLIGPMSDKNFSGFITKNYTAKEGNAVADKLINADQKEISLASVLLYQALSSFDEASQETVLRSEIVVVIADKSTRARQVFRGRNALREMGELNKLFFFASSKRSVDRQIAQVAKHVNVSVTVTTASELYEKIKEHRAANRTVKLKDAAFTISLNRMSKKDECATEKDVIKNAHLAHDWEDLTIGELIKNNALLVFADNSINTVLIGAANAGITITNRPIYRVQPSQAKADLFRALKGAEFKNIVASSSFKARSAVAEEVLDGVRYGGRILNSEVEEITIDEALTTFFYVSHLNKEFYAFARDRAAEIVPEKTTLHELLSAASNATKSYSSRMHTLTEDNLVTALGPEMASYFMAFKDLDRARDGSLESTLLSALMRFSGDIERSDITLKLVDHYITQLVASVDSAA